MAKPKTHKVGGPLETTIIFPTKAIVLELAEAKRNTKKRTQSANGTLGEKIGKACEESHLDRKAFSLACQLDAMDDERLHITYHSLLKYCEDLGVTKRALAQEELFDPNATEEERGGARGDDDDDPKSGRGGSTVTPIGGAARRVAEAAGKVD